MKKLHKKLRVRKNKKIHIFNLVIISKFMQKILESNYIYIKQKAR